MDRMFVIFWIVVALVALLCFKNARYAIRQYLSDRNRVTLTVYLILLAVLAYLVIQLTSRVMDFSQTVQQQTESY
jgi:hypothetical protein